MGSDLFLLLASSQPQIIDGAGKAVEAAAPGGQAGGFLNFLEAVLAGVEASGDIQTGAKEDGGKQDDGEIQNSDGPAGISLGFPLSDILHCDRQLPAAPPPEISVADGLASESADAGSEMVPEEIAENSPADVGNADPAKPAARGNDTPFLPGAHRFPAPPGLAGKVETGSSAGQPENGREPEVPLSLQGQPFAAPAPSELPDDSQEIQTPQPEREPHAAAAVAPAGVIDMAANSETRARDLSREPGPGTFLNIVAPEKTAVREKAGSGEQKPRPDGWKGGLEAKNAPDRKPEPQQAADPDPKWVTAVPVPQAPNPPETLSAAPETGETRKPASESPSTVPPALSMPSLESAAQPPALRGEVAFYTRLEDVGQEAVSTGPASSPAPPLPAPPPQAALEDPIAPRTDGGGPIQESRDFPAVRRAVAPSSPADQANAKPSAAGRAEGGTAREVRNRQDAPSGSAGNKDETQPAPPRRPKQDAAPSSDNAVSHAPAGLKAHADAAGHSQPAPVAFHPPARVSEPPRQGEAREAGEARPAERPQPEPEGLLPRSSEPVRDISLRISDAGQERVEVRLASRAGEVKVAVRTPDAELTGSLRSGLSDLVQRLEHSGFHAEAWTPARQPSSSGVERGTSDFADPQGGRQHGHPDGRQQKHQNQRQVNWIEEDEENSPERRSLQWSQLAPR
ncbi:MAG: hypothetical protein M1541_12905 [Acidobacteria bacterium]|nr:hypothetical protein [Acidobacteriota bacterium]